MANTFIYTNTAVAEESAMYLAERVLMPNLVNRNYEQEFGKKIGDTVRVKVPATMTGKTFTSSVTTSAVTETSVDVQLEKHFYQAVNLTADQLSLQLDDFMQYVAVPAIDSIVSDIEAYFIDRSAAGLARYLSGTAGTRPTTHADIIAADKTIFDNSKSTREKIAVIDSTTYASFRGLDIFNSVDYGMERPAALKQASLGRVEACQFFRSPNVGTFSFGDFDAASTTALTTTTTTSVVLSALAATTGTVPEGSRFSIAGVTGTFTVLADATIAANSATVTVDSVPDAVVTNGAVTLSTAPIENIMFDPAAIAGALVAPALAGPTDSAASYNGIGMRLIRGTTSTSDLSNTWIWDVYAGCKVVQPKLGTLFNG